ncbi:MAG: recombinase family protein [Bdellovibrionales bacterium]
MHALKSNGRVLRPPTGGPKQDGAVAVGRRSSGRPYGYDWVDGILVMDPKEYRVVQKILRLWRDGQSARAIARDLNQQGVPAQRSKKWSHGLVISIVERNKCKTAVATQHQKRNGSAK